MPALLQLDPNEPPTILMANHPLLMVKLGVVITEQMDLPLGMDVSPDASGLSDLALNHPHDNLVWRLLGAALTDENCTPTLVSDVLQDRLRSWEMLFSPTPDELIPKFPHMPADALAVWLLIMSYQEDRHLQRVLPFPSAPVETPKPRAYSQVIEVSHQPLINHLSTSCAMINHR